MLERRPRGRALRVETLTARGDEIAAQSLDDRVALGDRCKNLFQVLAPWPPELARAGADHPVRFVLRAGLPGKPRPQLAAGCSASFHSHPVAERAQRFAGAVVLHRSKHEVNAGVEMETNVRFGDVRVPGA